MNVSRARTCSIERSSLSYSSTTYSISPFSGASRFLQVFPVTRGDNKNCAIVVKIRDASLIKEYVTSMLPGKRIFTYADWRQSTPVTICIANSTRVPSKLVTIQTGIVYFIPEQVGSTLHMTAWKIAREATFSSSNENQVCHCYVARAMYSSIFWNVQL